MAASSSSSSSSTAKSSATTLTNHRRKRRRPANILAQHAHRQTQHTWLETHLWHAKRMHMINAWGYRLPRTTTDKGWRALYKAGLHLCTVCDISYVSCVSVKGREQHIAAMMSRLGTDVGDGGVLNEQYRGGVRQGEVLLHHIDTFPHGLITVSQFMWRPKRSAAASDESAQRELWLWLHAAVYDEALSTLRAASAESECVVDELRGELCRFELTGARSQQVLARVLRPLLADDASAAGGNATWRLLCETDLRSSSSLPPSVVLGVTAAHPGTLKGKQSIKQPFSVTPTSSSAIPTAASTSTAVPASSAQLVNTLMNWPTQACSSELWDRDVRQRLTASTAWGKKKDKYAVVLQSRAQQQQQQQVTEHKQSDTNNHNSTTQTPQPTIPTTTTTTIKQNATQSNRPPNSSTSTTVSKKPKPAQTIFDDLTTPLHCLIIQRPSPSPPRTASQQHSRGLFSGYDLIVPAGFASPVWRALVYAGARAEGLEERRRRLNEAGGACFPVDYPDCAAGWMWERWTGEADKAAWLRHPPNKRVNWQRTGVTSPYQPDWGGLVGKGRVEGAVVVEEGERRRVDGSAKGWDAVKGSEAAREEKVEQTAEETEETPRKKTKLDEEQTQSRNEMKVAEEDDKTSKEQDVQQEHEEEEADDEASEALVRQEESASMQVEIPTTQPPTDTLMHHSPAPYLLPYYVLRDWRKHISVQQQPSTPSYTTPYSTFASPAFTTALLPVSITPLSRGTVEYNAHICLPTPAQLTALITRQPLVQPSDLDHSTADGRWVGVDERLHGSTEVAESGGGSAGCTYECVGYVTSGLFSYLQGQGEGLGCVSARGVAAAFELSCQAGKRCDSCIVLVRNVTSRTYRPAYMRLR